MNTGREFYEQEYHYDEDVEVIDQKRLQRFFKHVDFSRIHIFLDVGCGVGWALRYCFDKTIKCVGFDISEKAIYLSKNILHQRITTLVADGEKLPFKDGTFDLISSLGTIEHFSSPTKGLEEIKRVTKKGGQILLVVPNSYWVLNKVKLYKGTEQPQEMLATLGEWARFIQKYNLDIKDIRKDIGPKILKNKKPIGVLKRLLLKFTITLPVLFAYQFIFICRRQ